MRSNLAHSKISRPRMPRQHAQIIQAAWSDSARAVLWAKVPAEWRSLVQAHITLDEERIQGHVRQQEKLRPAVKINATPALAEYIQPVCVLGDPVVAARHLAALRASINTPRVSQ